MKVIKRDSRLQEFDLEKIKRTLRNASDDINQPMNQGDLNSISDEIEKRIFRDYKDTVPSAEIRNIINDTLRGFGFSKIAESYINSII